LIVEDQPINTEILRRMLVKAGFAVTLAGNGHEAVEICKATSFDLILMDVQMPIMDGIQATRTIRALDNHRDTTPIIAVTAHALSDEVQTCLSAGMNAHISKPYRFETLMGTIQEVRDAFRNGERKVA